MKIADFNVQVINVEQSSIQAYGQNPDLTVHAATGYGLSVVFPFELDLVVLVTKDSWSMQVYAVGFQFITPSAQLPKSGLNVKHRYAKSRHPVAHATEWMGRSGDQVLGGRMLAVTCGCTFTRLSHLQHHSPVRCPNQSCLR